MEMFEIMFLSGIVAYKFINSFKTEQEKINEIIQSTNCRNNRGEFPTVKKLNKDYYNIIIPNGVSFQKVKELEPIITTNLKKNVVIDEKDFRYFLTFKKEIKFKSVYPFELIKYSDEELKFPIGYNIENKLIWLNLSKHPNMILSGITSSGKSVFIHNMILQLLNSYDIEFTMIDLKAGIELSDYADLKQVRDFTFLPDEVYSILDKVEKDIFNRLNKIRNAKCKNYTEYNSKFPQSKINYHVVILEEIMSLNKDKDVMKTLKRCLSVCRATGTYFVLTSQRFDATVIDGAIKTNCDLRISFKVKSKTDSLIILDEVGAENIVDKGRCIFNTDGELQEVQCFYVTNEQIQSEINKYPLKEDNSDLISQEREWFN